jgi:hypothetical protein
MASALGFCLARLRLVEEGLGLLERAVSADPASVIVAHNHALALATVGRHEDAVGGCKEYIARMTNPAAAGGFLTLGIVFADAGRTVESLAAFDEAERIDQNVFRRSRRARAVRDDCRRRVANR